jgi:hypothetical protein
MGEEASEFSGMVNPSIINSFQEIVDSLDNTLSNTAQQFTKLEEK